MYMQTSTYQQVNHYYPYGGVMVESTGGDVQRYKYNGKELGRMHGLDWYDYGARHYDAAIGSWPTMDPLAEKYYSLSPYNYCGGNPIRFVDPDGCFRDEFDSNGIWLSNLGGNDIDFYHQSNGNTRVVNKITGSENTIYKGERYIRNYSHRDESVSVLQLTNEFITESGPANSLFAEFSGEEWGPFSSLYSYKSTYTHMARKHSINHPSNEKGTIAITTLHANPYSAGFDMWEQFIGEANISWYNLGDIIMYLLIDTKSNRSLFYHFPVPNRERGEEGIGYGNTNQTYIWTERISERNKKYQQKIDYDNRIYQNMLQGH